MKIRVEGQCFVLTGAFDLSGNKRTLVGQLEAAGATVKNTTSSLTTVVVAGRSQWPTNAEEFARQRGLPVLTEAQAIELLERGELELEEDAEPDAPLGALIGEARAALDGELDARTWDTLTGLLDRCTPERQASLVDYLSGPLDHWTIHPHARYEFDDESRDYDARRWAEAGPRGELRVAPRAWLSEALIDGAQPKHTLARALMLTGLKLTNKDVIAIIASGAFDHATSLDLGEHQAKRSGAVFKAIATSPMAASLKAMRLESYLGTHARALDAGDALRLRRLRLNASTDRYDPDALASLCASSWVEELEELHLESHYSYHANTPALNGLRNLPALERVVIEPRAGVGVLATVFDSLPETKTLSFVGRMYNDDTERTLALLDRPLDVRELDVSGLTSYDGSISLGRNMVSTLDAHLFSRLPGSRMCARLTRVRLGPWRTDALAEAFAEHGVDVE